MPTKKKADKGEGRSSNSSAGKGEAKAAPVEVSQTSAGESTRATEASKKGNTTSGSKRSRSASAEKPRAKRDTTAKASTKGARRKPDPVSAVLSDALPTRELAPASLALGLDHEIAAYDAAYVVLADSLELPLVTADESLLRRLADTHCDVRWLGEFGL